VSTEFDHAVQKQSAEDITRYFKIFPLLGEDQVGLDKYSQFVCAIVSGKAQASLTGPRKFYKRERKKEPCFLFVANLFSRLFLL
jgi:hypothetical protein